MSSNRGHRAGQCAPEVPRTRIRARGDLQEGNGCASRCQSPLFPVPIPILSSTKSAFLCAFSLRNPHFRGFRAQNQGFCALLESGTLVFWLFEHKIGVFVRLLWKHCLWKQKSAQIFCFCALLIYYSGFTAAVVASGRRSRPDVVTGALPPERCCRSVAAGALPPERCRRSVAAEETAPAGYFTSS